MFTLGFPTNSIRASMSIWRLLLLVPNLNIGQGRANLKTAHQNAQEHHKVIKRAFEELQAKCDYGGFKTVICGR